jgi:hypothetical protein
MKRVQTVAVNSGPPVFETELASTLIVEVGGQGEVVFPKVIEPDG